MSDRAPTPIRVLSVEDNSDDTALMLRALAGAGFEASWKRVETAAALRAALSDHQWDVCLSDYSLPSFDAREALEIVRLRQPGLPFIVVSGTIGEDTAVEIMRAGADDYLLKGHLVRLGEAVRHAVDDAAALKRSESLVDAILRGITDGVVTTDRDGAILYFSVGAEKIFGHPAAEVIGTPVGRLIPERLREAHREQMRRFAEPGGAAQHLEHPAWLVGLRKSGEEFPIESVISRIEAGKEILATAVIRDITERSRSEEERARTAEQLRLLESAVRNAVDAVVITDATLGDPIVQYVNPAFTRLSGYTAAETVGRPIRSTHAVTLDAAVMTQLLKAAARREMFVSESEARRKDGSPNTVELHIAPIHDAEGRHTHFVTVLHDITERKQTEREMRRLALHDALTGLPNRTLLLDRAEQAVAAARRDASSAALLLLDLDRFKDVNDTFGHATGDDVLCRIGPRLRAELRETDTVARLGGDEFAVVLPEADAAHAREVADRLLRSLVAPLTVEGHSVDVVASVGIALYPDHTEDAAGLLRCADIAMYVAKARGSGAALYAEQLDTFSSSTFALGAELRRAIVGGELVLHYQPVVTIPDGRLLGVEALVRWRHPTRGLLPPSEFIALAERTGLMKPLTEWVIGEACHQHARWQEGGLATETAVNVSMRGLVDPEFAGLVERLVRRGDGSRARLRVEITESAIMADPERAMTTVNRLAELGVPASIDDFGTGYSSLAYLQRLAVDTVKIDRSFVGEVVRSEGSAAIVRSVVDLSRGLGLGTIAEGVEDRQTWERLAAFGCLAAQGYFIARPVPPEEIEPLLRRGRFSVESATWA